MAEQGLTIQPKFTCGCNNAANARFGGVAMTKHIAVVDDDRDVRNLLQRSLAAEGYAVSTFAGGAGLENALDREPHDLVLLDVGLPDFDGLTLTRRLREKFDIGIIIISGRADLSDRIVGLELGADDYVVKPFELKEVHARIRSVLRRQERGSNASATPEGEKLRFGNWTLDTGSRTLRTAGGSPVTLTTGEYRLLETLARYPCRVLSRATLLDHVHDNDTPAFDRSIDVCITRLRKKLSDDSKNPEIIKTVRNSGYIFVSKVDAA
jgi:DNA-binding response OmpR family regulator